MKTINESQKGKKRMKNTLPHLFGHPHSRVFHEHLDIIPRESLQAIPGHPLRGNGQSEVSSLRHGLQSIQDDIQKNLLELVRIA